MENVDVDVDKNKSKKRMLSFNFLKNLFLKTTKEIPENQPTELIENQEELIPTDSKKKEMESINFEESEKDLKPRHGLHNTCGDPKETQLVVLNEIKSEVNLLKFPIFALSRQGAKKPSKIEYGDSITRGDERIDFFWRVSANVQYGFPGTFDKKVFKAIEQIINQNGWSDTKPIQNPVVFSIYQICKIIKIKDSGKNIKAIKESFKRLVLTGIESQGAFYQKGKKQSLYENTFHLFESIIFRDEKLSDGTTADTNYLFLGKIYLESLNAFYVKKIDYKYYQGLKSDIARRLYEILDIKFYGLKRHCVSIDYEKLCALLPIKQQQKYSDAKRYLKPAHDELTKTNFLKAVEWEKVSRREWQIKYFPSKETMQKINKEAIEVEPEPQKLETSKESPKPKQAPLPQEQPKQETAPRQTEKENPLILELTKRGVAKSQVQKLITEYETKYPDSNLLDVLKCYDHKDRQGEFANARNKAGLLVGMIKTNDCKAPGYSTQAEQAQTKQEADKRKQRKEEQEKKRDQEAWEAHGTTEAKFKNWWGGFSWYAKKEIAKLDDVYLLGLKETVKEEIKNRPHTPPDYKKYKEQITQQTKA